MRKNVYQGLFLAVVFFVGCPSVFAPTISKQSRDQSVPVVGASDSPVRFVIREKAKLAVDLFLEYIVGGIATEITPQKDDLKQLALRFINAQKYELKDLGFVDTIRISGGILILSPGTENSVRYLALPEKRDKVVCKKTRNGVDLGFLNGGKKPETIDDVVMFVVTYVGGVAPKIDARGTAQVFARNIYQGSLLEVDLADSARYVAQNVTASDLKVMLTKTSSYNLVSSRIKNLIVIARDEAQADIIGCSVERKACVKIEGHSFRRPSRVSLQGTVPEFEAHVAGGILDAASFKASNVQLYPSGSAKAVQVYASSTVAVLPGLRSSDHNPDLVVEYMGDPYVAKKTSKLRVTKATTAMSVVAALGSVDGFGRTKSVIQNTKEFVGKGMDLVDSFSAMVRG